MDQGAAGGGGNEGGGGDVHLIHPWCRVDNFHRPVTKTCLKGTHIQFCTSLGYVQI